MRDGIEDVSGNIQEGNGPKLETKSVVNTHILLPINNELRNRILFVLEKRELITIGEVFETLVNEEAQRLETP